jgi:hypothetical protein
LPRMVMMMMGMGRRRRRRLYLRTWRRRWSQ